MKNFLPSISLAVLAFSFTLQGTHGMNLPDVESRTGGMKRLLEKDRAGNPAIPLGNDALYFNIDIPHDFFENILVGYTSLLPTINMPHRLVCKNWERGINWHVKKLDLSARRCTPFEISDQLMNSLVPVEVGGGIRFHNGFLYPNLQIYPNAQYNVVAFKHKDQVYDIHKTEIALGNNIPIVEVDFWRSRRLGMIDNPLPSYFTDIAVDLGKFSNLESLSLDHNTGVSDEVLSKVVKLNSWNLSDNKLITDESLSKLTNLTELNICWASNVTGNALASLTNLTRLYDSYARQDTNWIYPHLEEFKKIFVPEGGFSLTEYFKNSVSYYIPADHYDVFDIDYSQCLEYPHFKELCYLDGDTTIKNQQQAKMFAFERLCSLIKKDEKKFNDSEYQAITRWYETRVLVPNIYGLGYGEDKDISLKRKSTYLLYPNNTPYSEADHAYYETLKRIKSEPRDEDWDLFADFCTELEKKVNCLIKNWGKTNQLIGAKIDSHIKILVFTSSLAGEFLTINSDEILPPTIELFMHLRFSS